MAVGRDGQVQRIARALQAMRRGEVETLVIRGDEPSQEVARTVVAEYAAVFELDVVVEELPDGFGVRLREPREPRRTIELLL